MPQIKPKPRAKIVYQVTYTPKLATQVFDLMSKCDLGIAGGQYPTTELWSWTTTTKVDQAYRQKMRRTIKKALKKVGITQVHSIKKIM